MSIRYLEKIKALSVELPDKIYALKMLVLFGSRARGNTRANSDWDFAVIYDEKIPNDRPLSWFEIPLVLGDIFNINSDEIDVVELNHCSPLIAFHIARDGKLVYEQEPGEFAKFQIKAWKHYADTAKFRKAQRQSIELWLQKWGV